MFQHKQIHKCFITWSMTSSITRVHRVFVQVSTDVSISNMVFQFSTKLFCVGTSYSKNPLSPHLRDWWDFHRSTHEPQFRVPKDRTRSLHSQVWRFHRMFLLFSNSSSSFSDRPDSCRSSKPFLPELRWRRQKTLGPKEIVLINIGRRGGGGVFVCLTSPFFRDTFTVKSDLDWLF